MRTSLRSVARVGIAMLLWSIILAARFDLLAAAPSVVRDFELISINTNGVSSGDGASINPVISSNGQFIAFVSKAANLVRYERHAGCLLAGPAGRGDPAGEPDPGWVQW